jgi:hypothetical protein
MFGPTNRTMSGSLVTWENDMLRTRFKKNGASFTEERRPTTHWSSEGKLTLLFECQTPFVLLLFNDFTKHVGIRLFF